MRDNLVGILKNYCEQNVDDLVGKFKLKLGLRVLRKFVLMVWKAY